MIPGDSRWSHRRRHFRAGAGLAQALALLACMLTPVAMAEQTGFSSLLQAAATLRDTAAEARTGIHPVEAQKQARLWLAALVQDGEPRFRHWQSEQRAFAVRTPPPDSPAHPFPGASPGSAVAPDTAHGAHGGPLIHLTHFNTAVFRYLRENGLYEMSNLRSIAARDASLPAPPGEAMVALTGWWPLAGDQATPLPLWDDDAPLRPGGANGYLNWPRIARVAAAHGNRVAGAGHAPRQFAGRAISDPRIFPREAFYRVRPSLEHREALMANPQFRRATIIALGRPLQAGDELALVAFHVLHFGLEEGVWLTYWWDVDTWQTEAQQDTRAPGGDEALPLPAPWRNFRGDMTVSPDYPREADGSPNICFNPWFDAVFPDSGQGNGLTANCLSCHLRAGIPATGRLRVTRGRPDIDSEDSGIIHTHMLWSLANPRRTDAR